MTKASPGYPYNLHPCWSDCRQSVWERIHLPVARECNVKCRFCNHGVGTACHSSAPGTSAKLMDPEEAIERVERELARRPNLRIAAVSGPGEPLANRETFALFTGLQSHRERLAFCLSTNGVLLSECASQMYDVGVSVVSVSMSAITPLTAARIYDWARVNGNQLIGPKMGEEVITRQMEGIETSRELGIHVKVNSVLIPGVNDAEMASLSKALKKAGAELQNIVPLIPNGDMSHIPRPTSAQIAEARRSSARYIKQFQSCAQCRSDVVGIPGRDTPL